MNNDRHYVITGFTRHNHLESNYICQKCSRSQAENSLAIAPDGAWIHRESRYENCSALTVKVEGIIQHHLIQKTENVWRQVKQDTFEPLREEISFKRLLRTIGGNPDLQILNRIEETNVESECNIAQSPLFFPMTKDQAFHALQAKAPGTYLFRPSDSFPETHITCSYKDAAGLIIHTRLTKSLKVDGSPHQYLNLEHYVQCHSSTLKYAIRLMVEKLDQELIEEFSKLPDNREDFSKCAYGQKYMDQNRYGNILPFDHNAFQGIDFYYNASLLFNGSAIASQGPEPKHIPNFWKMICQTKASTIVMLTRTDECCQYWPDLGCELSFGDVHIKCLQEKQVGNVINRTIAVNGNSMDFIQYIAWPDHGVVEPRELAQVIKHIDAFSPSKPLVVHCRAGVGRTGTLFAALFSYQQQGETYFTIANEIRKGRIGAIQTPDQYICGYRAMEELLKG